MHLVVMIEGLRNDHKIAAKAAQQLLWLSPLSQLYIGKVRSQGFVLGFGNSPSRQIPSAVRVLKEVLSN
jgi:DNA-binding transcriptional MocR family regulator